MSSERKLNCVISGSFEKFKPEIDQTIDTFTDLGVNVLAPDKGWLYVPHQKRSLKFRPLKSEIDKTIKEIEDEFLRNLSNSDFLYLVDVGGYVGESSGLELGFAMGSNKPIYAREPISTLLEINGDWNHILTGIKVLSPEHVIVDFGILSRK